MEKKELTAKKKYNIEILAESEKDCQDALSLIKKLLHTFTEGMTWKDDKFSIKLKIDHMLSQDK